MHRIGKLIKAAGLACMIALGLAWLAHLTGPAGDGKGEPTVTLDYGGRLTVWPPRRAAIVNWPKHSVVHQ